MSTVGLHCTLHVEFSSDVYFAPGSGRPTKQCDQRARMSALGCLRVCP